MEKKALIFVVEDEESIRELYACAIEGSNMEVETFNDGEEFFSRLNKKQPDLVILDIMLDGMNGFDILRTIKEDSGFKEIPVIMASAKGEETNKVKGLNLGADDYIAKPFGVMELNARINAVLRRTAKTTKKLSFKDIVLDEQKHVVFIKDEEISLTLKEYNLLKLLIKNKESVVEREVILNKVWGENSFYETRTLDMHIKELRKKIGSSVAVIETIRGVGYILK